MSLRPLMRAALGAALLTPVCLIVAAAPAGAAGPMITVTPNSGLTDGQAVTITASGFTFPVPDSVAMTECTMGAVEPTIFQCDFSILTAVSTSVDNYSAPYTVQRHINTKDSGLVDCAAPNSCELLSGATGTDQYASAPINFTAPQVDLSILNARSIRRVTPGGPVEVRVRAANEGPATTTWDVSQTPGPGLAATSETCGRGGIIGPNGACTYSSTSPKVGHAVKTVFNLVASPGFAGAATDQVCVHDENANDADPNPSNNCSTVSVVVR